MSFFSQNKDQRKNTMLIIVETFKLEYSSKLHFENAVICSPFDLNWILLGSLLLEFH